MTSRYAIAAVSAALITLGIFYVMQLLILVAIKELDDPARGRVIDFVRLKKESELELRKRRLPEKLKPEEPPPPPEIDVKFIGMVGASEDKIAIFLDGNEFLLAKVGETIKEHFRVEEIGYDTLRMGYTDPQFEDEHRVLHLGE